MGDQVPKSRRLQDEALSATALGAHPGAVEGRVDVGVVDRHDVGCDEVQGLRRRDAAALQQRTIRRPRA